MGCNTTLITSESCFNTDDGIRRAAMYNRMKAMKRYVTGFNTDDGIRRAAIYHQRSIYRRGNCFNTDDGIRRAAIILLHARDGNDIVSIPMTVLGGLQSPPHGRLQENGQSFNTDDGIRRAAMQSRLSPHP